MCLICTEWQKGNLTTKEAFRNLGESLNVASDEEDHDAVEHLLEFSNKLMDAEVPFEESDEQMDRMWWEKTHGSQDE
jgi:hypothetical protein